MKSLKIKFALICTLFFWASAFAGIRIGLQGYSPGALALLRFLIASVSIAFMYWRLPQGTPMSWRDRIQLGLIGVAAIGIYNICLNIGETTVSAGIASFVIGLIPVLTILLSVIFLRERFHSWVWFGIGLSFCGLLLMVVGEKTGVRLNAGVLIILISSLMGAFYCIAQKPYLRTYHPVAVTAWVIWGGTLMLMYFSPALSRELLQANSGATAAAIYLGIFPGAMAYVGWSYVLSHYSASRASMFLYILPVLSTVLGIILLQEYPSVLSLSGGMLALAGAFIANRFSVQRTRVNLK